MHKKIAVINDLSGVGRCSLTAALPVIATMGAQPCPLPTAILSAQTGYDSYYFDDYTEKMDNFRQEWEKLQLSFDGIYTGFVANEAQIARIFRFLDSFYKKGTFLLVDPVMGDHGEVHKHFTEGMLGRMKELVWRADVVTPNLTELCLLTDTDYKEFAWIRNEQDRFLRIRELCDKLLNKVGKIVVVSGIISGGIGGEYIGNFVCTRKKCHFFSTSFIGGSYSGTGDLFASVIAGGLAAGKDIFEVTALAGEFIAASIEDSFQEGTDRNEGVNFERHLDTLLK